MLRRFFSQPEENSRTYSVFVIEDDEPIANIIQELLQDDGYTVTVANNAKDALKLLASDPLPDAFIVDYMLPDMNGKQFIESIRVMFGRSKVPPVLMLTASKEGESVANALQITDFLPKPFNNADLLDHISKLVGRAK